MPKVSIVIPMYNAGPFVGECIDSCLRQTYSDIEIIVVDDASTDNSFSEVWQRLNKVVPVKILRNEKNLGTAESRNRGYRESSGKYIAFLDADDMLTEDSIECRVKILDNLHAVDVVAGHSYILREGEKYATAEDRSLLRIREGKLVGSGTGMIRSTALLMDGGFDKRCVLNEDREFWARVLITNKAPAVKILRPISFYRIHPKSKVKKASEEAREASRVIADEILGASANKPLSASEPLQLINWGL